MNAVRIKFRTNAYTIIISPKEYLTLTENEILISRIEDKIRLSRVRAQITSTGFLNLREKAEAAALCRQRRVHHAFYGGYPEAERTVLLLNADNTELPITAELEHHDNPLCLLRCSLPAGARSLSHRDYLGSLTALGIKREVIGDILVFADSADIIILKSIAPFLTEHYKEAGRVSLSCECMAINHLRIPEIQTESIRESVASLRLDNLIGSVFNLSRTDAVSAILHGEVWVNDFEQKKPDTKISPGDKLVLRGAGKAIFAEVLGTTRKGRLSVRFEKYR